MEYVTANEIMQDYDHDRIDRELSFLRALRAIEDTARKTITRALISMAFEGEKLNQTWSDMQMSYKI